MPIRPTSSSNKPFNNPTHSKGQVNFDIPLFARKFDANEVNKWLNQLQSYLFVNRFSNNKNIRFALLKDETYVNKLVGIIMSLRWSRWYLAPKGPLVTIWEEFVDALREYYLVKFCWLNWKVASIEPGLRSNSARLYPHNSCLGGGKFVCNGKQRWILKYCSSL